MPATTIVKLFPPELPAGACFNTYQELANAIIGGATAQFNSDIGNTYFNTGSSTPSAANREYPWLDCNSNWWVYKDGYWTRKHPYQQADKVRLIWTGDTTALETFDGGTSGPVTDFSGPMWEVDSSFAAKFPVGVGTFASSGTVAVGASTTGSGVSGTDTVTLTAAQMPIHSHDIAIQVPGYGGEDGTRDSPDGGTNSQPITNDTTTFPGALLDPLVQAQASQTGGGAAHNNLPPFYGVYFIKRTARVYYTSSSQAQGDCGCGTSATLYTGSGSPEGVIEAAIGSLYTDTTNDLIYVKTTNGGNTGWQQQA